MAKRSLKCAKPDKKDFGAFRKLMVLENLFDSRYWYSNEEDWREWDEDDKDKSILLDCEKHVRSSTCMYSNETVDNDLILCEYVRRLFLENPSSFRRVEMAAIMAIDNCFDPEKDYIDWRPDIQNAINYYNQHKEEVDKWCKENVLPEEEEDCKIYTINEAFCKIREYKVNDSGEYVYENDECTITFNFTDNTLLVRTKIDGPKSVKISASEHDGRLNLFQLRDILRMFKCVNTLEAKETNWN